MENKFVVTGAIIETLFPTTKGVGRTSGKPYVIKEMVVTLPGNEQWPRRLVLKTMSQDIVNKLETLSVGQVIPVLEFDPDAHEYNGRWYAENKLWRIELAAPVAQPQVQPQPQPQATANQWDNVLNNNVTSGDVVDDIPF